MSDFLQNKCFSKLNEVFVKNITVFYCFNDFEGNKKSNNKLFVLKDDSVYGLCDNEYGLLGLGHNREVTEPTIINQLCNKQIIEFNNGLSHCIARSIDGKLYSFGSNNYKQLGYKTENEYNNRPKIIESLINENIIEVSCGQNHTIVLTQNGEVFGWGDNSYGQIGINSKEKFITNPTLIIGFNGEKIQSISCGYSHSMALTVNGNVFSWGSKGWGQLGINSTDDSHFPQLIKIENKNVMFKKISCGLAHSLLLSTNGDIYSFGSNDCSQLGYETDNKNYSTIPRIIETKAKPKFSDICCHFNEDISTALSSDGFCYVWGDFGKQVIKPLKDTKYKSCEEAIHDITDNTVRALYFISGLIVSNNLFDNNYSVIEKISKGSFGEVFKCKNRETKGISAVKRLEIEIKEMEKIVREIVVMSKLRNKCIVGYKRSWIENNQNNEHLLYIEMEYCLKTLSELKKQLLKELKCKTSICESNIGSHVMSELMKEVIEGVNYLHKNNIIHRDLKPLNILINNNNINGKYMRIADFGLSRFHDCEDQSLSADVGTIKYMAPEVIQSITRPSGRILYTNKVDIYSLGKIFDEVFDFSEQKFDSNKTNNKIKNIERMQKLMVSNDPEMRTNCEQLLNNCNVWLITIDEFEVKKILQKSAKTVSINSNFCIYFLKNRFYK